MTPAAEILPRLRAGSRGPRVKASKRMLHAALGPDAHNSQGTPRFGFRTVRDVILFQHRNGLSVSGVIGPRTWEKLLPFADGYAKLLMRIARDRDASTGEDRARDGRVHWAYAIVAIGQALWRYAQIRPYPRIRNLEGHVDTDCSGAVEIIALLEGTTEDPSGFGFNGSGYTGTLRAHGEKIAPSDAKRGDLVHYGNPDHVGMLLDDQFGRVFSFGSNPPSVRAARYRDVVMVTRNLRLKGD